MRMVRSMLVMVAGLSLLAVGAYAQEEAPPPPYTTAPEATPPEPPPQTYPAEPVPPPPEKHRIRVFAPRELSFQTGAGVSDFFGSSLTTDVDPGAAWDARLTVGDRSILALELGYVGAVNKVPGAFGSGYINSNGLDGDLRINFLPWRVEPYAFGGVGYNHMHLDDAHGDPMLVNTYNHDDDQLVTPVGGGVSGYLGRHATLDARFTYRPLLNTDINRQNPGERLDQWNVLARLGYEF